MRFVREPTPQEQAELGDACLGVPLVPSAVGD
jgi:hypothetical protein